MREQYPVALCRKIVKDQLKPLRFGAILSRSKRGSDMSLPLEKDEAHKIIDRMPPGATWDDLMQEIYVREAIESGLADSKEGRSTDVSDIRSEYGLPG
jgi:hypothetical protein